MIDSWTNSNLGEESMTKTKLPLFSIFHGVLSYNGKGGVWWKKQSLGWVVSSKWHDVHLRNSVETLWGPSIQIWDILFFPRSFVRQNVFIRCLVWEAGACLYVWLHLLFLTCSFFFFYLKFFSRGGGRGLSLFSRGGGGGLSLFFSLRLWHGRWRFLFHVQESENCAWNKRNREERNALNHHKH